MKAFDSRLLKIATEKELSDLVQRGYTVAWTYSACRMTASHHGDSGHGGGIWDLVWFAARHHEVDETRRNLRDGETHGFLKEVFEISLV